MINKDGSIIKGGFSKLGNKITSRSVTDKQIRIGHHFDNDWYLLGFGDMYYLRENDGDSLVIKDLKINSFYNVGNYDFLKFKGFLPEHDCFLFYDLNTQAKFNKIIIMYDDMVNCENNNMITVSPKQCYKLEIYLEDVEGDNIKEKLSKMLNENLINKLKYKDYDLYTKDDIKSEIESIKKSLFNNIGKLKDVNDKKVVLNDLLSDIDIIKNKRFLSEKKKLNEYLVKDMSFVKKLFSQEIYDFYEDIYDEYAKDYFPDLYKKGEEAKKNDDNDTLFEVEEEIVNRILDGKLNIPLGEYPFWYFFHNEVEIIKDTWLIHFTDSEENAENIVKNGFKIGMKNPYRLGITSANENYKGENGYNFAYEVDYYLKNDLNNVWYGDYPVIFKANGIKVYHKGDMEYEIIFFGNTARNINMIDIHCGEKIEYDNNKKYMIRKNIYCIRNNKNNKILYQNIDIKNVVSWFVKNYESYRKSLNEKRVIATSVFPDFIRIKDNSEMKGKPRNQGDIDNIEISKNPDLTKLHGLNKNTL